MNLKKCFGKRNLEILDYKNKLLERYSQNYARLKFGMFSRSLKHAKKNGLIKENLVVVMEGVPKKKPEVDSWTKKEFEKVIETFNLNDFYEYMSFSMIFFYYMT